MTRVDHLLVSVTDLREAQERWERTGLAATIGGSHPGGTSNALIRGPRRAYLELITASTDATSEAGRRVLTTQGPVSWALGVTEIEAVRAAVRESGVESGPVSDGSREKPDGEVLRWRICDLAPTVLHPFIPFLIEWEAEMPPGPAEGPVLTALTVECPDPRWLSSVLELCGLPLDEAHNRDFTHDDGEVTIRVSEGKGGLRTAEFALPDGPFTEVELDGLLVHRVRR